MGAMTCKVCGGSSFVTDGEYLICQICGYTLEISKGTPRSGGANASPAPRESEDDSAFVIAGGTLVAYRGKIADVAIPSGVFAIKDGAFSHTSIASIDIPGTVTSIGKNAFTRCTFLKSATIRDGVTSIGASAFKDCLSLESVDIPGSVTSIKVGAFEGCSFLKSVAIPDGVVSIDKSAFKNCLSLESVYIPDSVTSIDNDAFEGCSSLANVRIPGSVFLKLGLEPFRNTPWGRGSGAGVARG